MIGKNAGVHVLLKKIVFENLRFSPKLLNNVDNDPDLLKLVKLVMNISIWLLCGTQNPIIPMETTRRAKTEKRLLCETKHS